VETSEVRARYAQLLLLYERLAQEVEKVLTVEFERVVFNTSVICRRVRCPHENGGPRHAVDAAIPDFRIRTSP